MAEQPQGTVTMLFTDIEGSTRLLQRLGRDRYSRALELHRRLLREAFERHRGYEVDCEGDSFFVAFPRAEDAVMAAQEAQQALSSSRWPDGSEFRVRMGVHTGEPLAVAPKYVGLDVHRAARIMGSAHGGQVLVSQTTADLCAEEELHEISLRDLGLHRLKDLTEPRRLYQLVAEELPSEFPPLRTLENRPTNLPVQQTALIGREREIEEVGTLLRREDVHLVTLTGTGGTGKTRLALQVAADLVEEFASGVFFVSLAPISDSELVIPTTAQALGVREQSGEPLLDTLNEHLREKRLLLLLDNFEHVVQAAPSLASLLASAPELKVLVTSRTPVHLSGERSYEVPPLSLPDPSRLPKIEALTQYEAVALFIERAQAAKAGFAVTNENAPAIAEICVRLDGLPLALELAAARVRALPPGTLLARLDHRLKLLTGGAQDLDKRQRTLRATIEWSYELLARDERALFARLGVFVGGCRLDAAEAVCDPDGELAIDLLDGLTSLVERNLLRQKEDADGEPRFWMLETIREYAEERLNETVDAAAVRRRHAEHFLRLSEEAAGQLEGGDQQSTWMLRLEQEHDNLRAALTFWRGEPDSLLALALSLEPFWRLRGHWQEGRGWLEEALAADTRMSPQRLKALENTHYFAFLQRDTERARTLLEELLPLARQSENRPLIAMALNGLGNLALNEGDGKRAESLYKESLDFCEGEHDSIYPLSGLGFIAFLGNDYGLARAYLERSVTVGRLFKDDYEVAADIAILATVSAFEGDEQDALVLLQESLALARKIDSRPGLVTRCLPALAAVRSLQGNAEESVRLMGAYELLREQMGLRGGAVSEDIKHRVLAAARNKLEDEQIAAAFEAGRELTLDEALMYPPESDPAHR